MKYLILPVLSRSVIEIFSDLDGNAKGSRKVRTREPTSLQADKNGRVAFILAKTSVSLKVDLDSVYQRMMQSPWLLLQNAEHKRN